MPLAVKRGLVFPSGAPPFSERLANLPIALRCTVYRALPGTALSALILIFFVLGKEQKALIMPQSTGD